MYIVWLTGHVTETLPDLPYTTNPYNVNPLNKSAPGVQRSFLRQDSVKLPHPQAKAREEVTDDDLPSTSYVISLMRISKHPPCFPLCINSDAV